MFDGAWVEVTDRRSDEPQATSVLPWQYVSLLLCMATLSVIAAILYPDVFSAPFERF
jgi:hypothetical protein